MPQLIPVRVECYSGYIADEYPVCFELGGTRYDISEVTDRWYQGESNPEFPVSDYFRVITTGNEQYILKHEIGDDNWFMYK
jgi:hypothetical protein